MNKMKLLFLLLMSVQTSFGQDNSQIDSLFLMEISQQVKADILNSYKTNEITIEGDCYYGLIDGRKHCLSCFSIEWNPKWVGDINEDGGVDIVLKVKDYGLGGGGNAFGYDYRIVYLKDKEILNIDTFFGGGKFSNAFLKVDSIYKSTVFATLTENERARDIDEIGKSPLKEIKLQFIWNNGKLVEKSYLNCPFSKMDKRIFKPEIANVIRELSSNDLFEEEQTERLKLNNEEIYAHYSGCKTIHLTFSISRPCKNKKEFNSRYKKEEILEKLIFLKNNTQHSDLIENVILSLEKYGVVLNQYRYIPNYWSYRLLTSYFETEQRNFSQIYLEFINKYTKEVRSDFWKEIKR